MLSKGGEGGKRYAQLNSFNKNSFKITTNITACILLTTVTRSWVLTTFSNTNLVVRGVLCARQIGEDDCVALIGNLQSAHSICLLTIASVNFIRHNTPIS